MRYPVAFYNSKKYGTLIGEPIIPGLREFASNEEYEEIIPKVKEYYSELLNNFKNKGLDRSINIFLKKISKIAILDDSFKECLAKDLKIDRRQIELSILNSEYILNQIAYLKQNFRKIKKTNPLEYAEIVGELVSLLGLKRTLSEERKLPLTIAFEIPLEHDKSWSVELVNLSYKEAKRKLKKLKSG